MTVRGMLARMDSRELAEWMAYHNVEPFGYERDDLSRGIIASVIANANRDAKRRPRPYRPSEFMPFSEPAPEPEQSPEKQMKTAELMQKLMNAAHRKR